MKISYSVLLAFIFLMPCVVMARLGETREQCIERYGNVYNESKVDGNGVKLSLGDRNADPKVTPIVTVILFDNICHQINFLSRKLNYFKLDDVKAILEKNSDGHTWSEPKFENEDYSWSRSDGGKAVFTTFFEVDIESGAFEKLSKQGKDQQQKSLESQKQDKLKNF